MQSVIILGHIEQTREKAAEILKLNKIYEFDQEIFSSEKTIGIANIRKLQKNIFLKPLQSDKKAVILESFFGATIDAQNAFLKILEEPPASTIILILTTSLDFILPTVLSRCNLIDLTRKREISQIEDQINSDLLLAILENKENPLVIAQNHGKDRETALRFLEILMITAEKNLNTNPKFSKVLKKLGKTYMLIKSTNVNVRFALENLLLNLYSN
jgi:DNA polymerase III delta prime subunit